MNSLLNLNHDNDASRWYPLIAHPTQIALITDRKRFKVVPAGRRSGKTERAKRFIVREAMQNTGCSYFVAAPTRDQVKRVYWSDLKQLSFMGQMPLKVSESDLIIGYPNGASISLIGLDQPQRMEGVIWAGGIIDEIADTKAEAWPENISPALDTIDPRRPDYRAWAWLIGVPDGMNHYYDLAEYAGRGIDSDWGLYHWKSSEILPPDVIEAAKRRMSKRQYRQEYEASFETAAGKIYEDYSPLNYTQQEIGKHEQLLWFHDFNYTPLSSGIGVRRDGQVYVLDEIILTSAIARQSAMEFTDKFKDHGNKNVIVYGDPAGRAGEKHGHNSDYTEIENVLRTAEWKYERRVKAAAPAIRDRQNAVRAKVANAADERTLFVNTEKAPYMHKGMLITQLKQGSTFLEEVTDYQHITTALGYFIDYEFPVRHKEEPLVIVPERSRNYWGARK